MFTLCDLCNRSYDDATCWTICPHSPLSDAVAVCRKHDRVNCQVCRYNAIDDDLGEANAPAPAPVVELAYPGTVRPHRTTDILDDLVADGADAPAKIRARWLKRIRHYFDCK